MSSARSDRGGKGMTEGVVQIPTYERKLLEYDDLIVPLVQYALKKTFSEKVCLPSIGAALRQQTQGFATAQGR